MNEIVKEKRSWSKLNIPGLIARKQVDYSVFQYGSHIPIEFHEDFNEANGGIIVNRGESRAVTLIVEDKEYNAVLINVDRTNTKVDTLQIRYDGNNDLKMLLKERFHRSYEYIEQNKVGRQPVIVPDQDAEFMEFYRTDEPFKYVVKLITKTPVQQQNVREIVTHIYNYIAAKGFTYSEDLIRNFFLSLKTKPFVILAGISGTGKSKLVQLVANAVGATAENGRYTLIPVRPDWNDSADLLGYEDLQGSFKPGPLTQVISQAMKNPTLPYFVCLDEMNLARVEYYFSDFLSIIESRTLKNGVLSIAPIQINGEKSYYFPENLYVIGTVNMDETTHSFSRKVLDRANTIELTEIDLSALPQIIDEVEPINLGNDYFKSEYVLLKDCLAGEEEFLKTKIQILEDINKIIEPGGFQVGYRVRDEFCFYLLYNKRWGLLPEGKALDFLIMQKILPRIQGSAYELEKILQDLKNYCIDRYPLSFQKVDFMLRRLQNDGFTSFWP